MQDPGFPTGSPLSPSPPRKRTRLWRQRRPHMVFSAQQLCVLEEFFEGKSYGTYEESETLAARLNLQEDQVKVWLKNRRAKEQRLQRLRKQQGQGGQAVPQELAVCAPQPAPVPSSAGPACQEGLLLPASPVFPAIPLHPEKPVFPLALCAPLALCSQPAQCSLQALGSLLALCSRQSYAPGRLQLDEGHQKDERQKDAYSSLRDTSELDAILDTYNAMMDTQELDGQIDCKEMDALLDDYDVMMDTS
ncbi:homeobox protein ESX1-like [Myotis lucifugus]|uniref:homeobox protein ESX1-like n=1 Tax=Myotis lucifugus TaxID=59463 RepID=UPI0006D72ABC|nr:homeobox protein ESX1-like [Myotis lucifugus]